MRKKYVFLGLISLPLFIILITFVFSPKPETLQGEIILGAHRGSSVNYTENTFLAFEDAVNNDKYKFVEFDVQYTLDKIPVLFHDNSLLRLQGIFKRISDLTYEELTNLSKFNIPGYDEVMDSIAGKKPLNIEIKSQGNLTEDIMLAEYIIEDIEKRGLLNSTLLSSVSQELILHINKNYNNFSPEFWDEKSYIHNFWETHYRSKKKYINTGLIFWVTETTFTQRIPIVDMISEKIRNSVDSQGGISIAFVISGANYLMVHGANINQYESLIGLLPHNSFIVLWKFNDEMHLILHEGMAKYQI